MLLLCVYYEHSRLHLPYFYFKPEEAELEKKAKDEEARLKRLQGLFEGCRFFLAREVPREALTFVVRSFGGVVSWEESGASGAPYPASDESITHHVVDRPTISHRYLSRLVYIVVCTFTHTHTHTLEL